MLDEAIADMCSLHRAFQIHLTPKRNFLLLKEKG